MFGTLKHSSTFVEKSALRILIFGLLLMFYEIEHLWGEATIQENKPILVVPQNLNQPNQSVETLSASEEGTINATDSHSEKGTPTDRTTDFLYLLKKQELKKAKLYTAGKMKKSMEIILSESSEDNSQKSKESFISFISRNDSIVPISEAIDGKKAIVQALWIQKSASNYLLDTYHLEGIFMNYFLEKKQDGSWYIENSKFVRNTYWYDKEHVDQALASAESSRF